MKPLAKLNAKHRAFCAAYVGAAGGSVGRAAEMVGYTSTYGSKLLNDVLIQSYLEELRAEIRKANVLDAQKIHEIWHEIATDREAEARDRLSACRDAARALGMNRDQLQVTGIASAAEMRALLGIGGGE